MFTIKEAAERANLSPDLLRAWERRYGVVSPSRSATGYRLYSAADIERLALMRHLVASGFRPLEAVLHLDSQGGEEHARTARDQAAEAGQEMTSAPLAFEGPRAFVAAAVRMDAAALRRFFDGLAAVGSFETVVETQLFPALHALGQAWAEGTLSVAGEHAASAATLRWLGAQYEAAARDPRRPQVLVGLPPGAHHELGALAHAVALRRHGVDVLYLGKNLPAADWVTASVTTAARLVLVGVVLEADVAAAARVAQALQGGAPATAMMFGGAAAGATELRRYGAELPADFNRAAAAVDVVLGRSQGAGT